MHHILSTHTQPSSILKIEDRSHVHVHDRFFIDPLPASRGPRRPDVTLLSISGTTYRFPPAKGLAYETSFTEQGIVVSASPPSNRMGEQEKSPAVPCTERDAR